MAGENLGASVVKGLGFDQTDIDAASLADIQRELNKSYEFFAGFDCENFPCGGGGGGDDEEEEESSGATENIAYPPQKRRGQAPIQIRRTPPAKNSGAVVMLAADGPANSCWKRISPLRFSPGESLYLEIFVKTTKGNFKLILDVSYETSRLQGHQMNQCPGRECKPDYIRDVIILMRFTGRVVIEAGVAGNSTSLAGTAAAGSDKGDITTTTSDEIKLHKLGRPRITGARIEIRIRKNFNWTKEKIQCPQVEGNQ